MSEEHPSAAVSVGAASTRKEQIDALNREIIEANRLPPKTTTEVFEDSLEWQRHDYRQRSRELGRLASNIGWIAFALLVAVWVFILRK